MAKTALTGSANGSICGQNRHFLDRSVGQRSRRPAGDARPRIRRHRLPMLRLPARHSPARAREPRKAPIARPITAKKNRHSLPMPVKTRSGPSWRSAIVWRAWRRCCRRAAGGCSTSARGRDSSSRPRRRAVGRCWASNPRGRQPRMRAASASVSSKGSSTPRRRRAWDASTSCISTTCSNTFPIRWRSSASRATC